MKKNYIAALFILLMTAISFGQDKEVTAEGFGAIQGGNKKLAEKEATDDALRRALEMEIGAQISAKTVVENYQLVSDKIISKVSGYIKSYKVLETKEADGILTVKVKAVVKASNLKNDLELIQTTLERMNYPRIVLMVAEQNVGSNMFSYWWGDVKSQQTNIGASEMALSAALLEKNFKIVDKNVLQHEAKVKPAYQMVDISNQAILEMTTNIDADIVITGKAIAQNRGPVANSSMNSVLANVTLRAINLKDGNVLGSSYASAAKVHIDPITAGTLAIEEATKNVSEKLVKDMITSWNKTLNNGEEFKIIIKNVNDSVAVFKIEKDINEIKTITATILEKFENKTAEFRVMFRGNSAALAQTLEALQLKPVEISAKKLVLEHK